MSFVPAGKTIQAARVRVIGIDDAIPVAKELCGLPEFKQWCQADLTLANATHLLQEEFSPDTLSIIVHRDPASLSQVIPQLRHQYPRTLFMFVNLFQHPTPCLDLLVAGFDEFLSYPFQPEDVAARIQATLSKQRASPSAGAENVKKELTLEIGLRDLIGSSPSFSRVLREIKILARVDATVLITGETGTGKDLCARASHYTSSRSRKAFVPVNCGAIPDELFENELFGHERGAFTDGRFRHRGLIQEAEGGTIFLDDIESLSPKNQVKLLRFLQGNEYTPLGSAKPLKADVRIIAATNQDLAQRVRERMFREDLYFRLQVLSLSLPPLRERVEDIPSLAKFFLTRYCSKYGKPQTFLTGSAIQELKAHNWPGNVRELENVIHRAVLHLTSNLLSDSDISLEQLEGIETTFEDSQVLPFNQLKKEILARFERDYVARLLRLCDGNVTRAAQRAGKNRRAFWEIMRKHNLSRFAG